MVQKRHGKRDKGKVEKVSPIGELGILFELVVDGHDSSGDEVGKHKTSEHNENVLRNETPWGVTGSQESRLLRKVSQA